MIYFYDYDVTTPLFLPLPFPIPEIRAPPIPSPSPSINPPRNSKKAWEATFATLPNLFGLSGGCMPLA